VTVAGVVAIVVLLLLLDYRREKREWNGGICAATGRPWHKFDTDSHGGRGYVDDPTWQSSDGRVIWLSWPVDRRGCVYK
jgi:hypothetical protein